MKIIRAADEEYIQIASREFYLLQNVSHKNIVKMKDLYFSAEKETIYMVMELIAESQSLFDYVFSFSQQNP